MHFRLHCIQPYTPLAGHRLGREAAWGDPVVAVVAKQQGTSEKEKPSSRQAVPGLQLTMASLASRSKNILYEAL